jgi:hypothetical protein
MASHITNTNTKIIDTAEEKHKQTNKQTHTDITNGLTDTHHTSLTDGLTD